MNIHTNNTALQQHHFPPKTTYNAAVPMNRDIIEHYKMTDPITASLINLGFFFLNLFHLPGCTPSLLCPVELPVQEME